MVCQFTCAGRWCSVRLHLQPQRAQRKRGERDPFRFIMRGEHV